MADEMFIEGKSYFSSKRAADLSGYAQDYIGQLARKGLIDAQRIGGLWYVSMNSLEGYKKSAETFKPEPPARRENPRDPSTLVFFDGKEYVSAARAAEITGYVPDYVGQLARSGHILSRQVGNRWYVEKDSILAHKREKDGLLAAVQSEAVGLQHKGKKEVPAATDHASEASLLKYAHDSADLLPVIKRQDTEIKHENSEKGVFADAKSSDISSTAIPIRKMAPHSVRMPELPPIVNQNTHAIGFKPRIRALPITVSALMTIVIVLSVGYTSVLRQNSAYAASTNSPKTLAASAEAALSRVGDFLEPLLTRELVYTRPDGE